MIRPIPFCCFSSGRRAVFGVLASMIRCTRWLSACNPSPSEEMKKCGSLTSIETQVLFGSSTVIEIVFKVTPVFSIILSIKFLISAFSIYFCFMNFFSFNIDLLANHEQIAGDPVQGHCSRYAVGDESNHKWEDVFHLGMHAFSKAFRE